MKHFLTYLTGLIFGLGISMSGMANPAKVLNFFDFAGTWDPSLVFVMGGAVTVSFFGYRALFKRYETPAFEPRFIVPTSRVIDAKLVGGSLVFGVGWGIAGFCPGGALPALGALDANVWVFFVALVAGIFAAKFMMKLTAAKAARRAA
ncbi:MULTISPECIES: DUF6691 family protein [Roseobacteraceae]|uniref:YeeE/YedE family protein n=1 Tax=Celeribacter baekdonensis B30 TaxID=1208323 RepID=K2JAJ2_9RHOB|nr:MULTISPECIES: DUF6691 family protein [Roseobacteraceae]EKE71867.1 hypothetical protein B30_08863 [Celeribacter baekdonensis B30]KAB6715286.1 permease [Roseobacter sp. TSBP12]